MYIKNKRDSSSIKGYSPFELLCNLKNSSSEVGYYSYTDRCVQLWTGLLHKEKFFSYKYRFGNFNNKVVETITNKYILLN